VTQWLVLSPGSHPAAPVFRCLTCLHGISQCFFLPLFSTDWFDVGLQSVSSAIFPPGTLTSFRSFFLVPGAVRRGGGAGSLLPVTVSPEFF